MLKKDQRHFLGSMGAMVAAVAVSKAGFGNSMISVAPGFSTRKNNIQKALVGIQMSPHTMLDEGIEACLDLIKSTAEVNAVFPYSHAFHTGTLGKPLRDLATDHGKPVRDLRGKVPAIWVKHHDEYFKNTSLRTIPSATGSGKNLRRRHLWQ